MMGHGWVGHHSLFSQCWIPRREKELMRYNVNNRHLNKFKTLLTTSKSLYVYCFIYSVVCADIVGFLDSLLILFPRPVHTTCFSFFILPSPLVILTRLIHFFQCVRMRVHCLCCWGHISPLSATPSLDVHPSV